MKPKRPFRNSFLCAQLVEQGLGLFQIERVEAFSEPAVDRSEQVASLIPLALIAPEPREAHRRVQFIGLCVLPLRNAQRRFEARWPSSSRLRPRSAMKQASVSTVVHGGGKRRSGKLNAPSIGRAARPIRCERAGFRTFGHWNIAGRFTVAICSITDAEIVSSW